MTANLDDLVASHPLASAAEVELGRAALWGAAGRTVRCTPKRRVVHLTGRDGSSLFGKMRVGSWARAMREWRWLLGEGPPLPLPEPVALFRVGSRSLLLMRAVAGRPVQRLMAKATNEELESLLVQQVAPQVAAMHGQGWVYRDLYWNHAYAPDLATDPVWIDVERAFRPRARMGRWVVKDLAGLVSSAQPPLSQTLVCAGYEAYLANGGLAVRGTAVLAKADRIRARQPRYG